MASEPAYKIDLEDFDKKNKKPTPIEVYPSQVPENFIKIYDRTEAYKRPGPLVLTQDQIDQAKRDVTKLRDDGIIRINFGEINQKYHRLAHYISQIALCYGESKQINLREKEFSEQSSIQDPKSKKISNASGPLEDLKEEEQEEEEEKEEEEQRGQQQLQRQHQQQ